jgi:uncharacterized protein YdcH (DUF465 family)
MKEIVGEMKVLKNENLKLNSDIRVIRNEHNEMSHSIYSLENKNQDLIRENVTLKDMVY